MFSVIRHSRAEEEDSRTDLLLASGSGRLAPLAAALIVTALVLVVAGAGFATALVIGGLEPVPSILLASAIVGFGLVFAGTTAVIAQVTTKARAARGLVGVVIGVSWVLRAIGDTLTARVREGDAVARIGGDEYAVLLANVSRAEADRIAGQLADAIAATDVATAGRHMSVTASIGIGMIEQSTAGADEVFVAADRAMYAAKPSGTGR